MYPPESCWIAPPSRDLGKSGFAAAEAGKAARALAFDKGLQRSPNQGCAFRQSGQALRFFQQIVVKVQGGSHGRLLM
jgi:hypothetical protein